jgi:hypothetical protein
MPRRCCLKERAGRKRWLRCGHCRGRAGRRRHRLNLEMEADHFGPGWSSRSAWTTVRAQSGCASTGLSRSRRTALYVAITCRPALATLWRRGEVRLKRSPCGRLSSDSLRLGLSGPYRYGCAWRLSSLGVVAVEEQGAQAAVRTVRTITARRAGSVPDRRVQARVKEIRGYRPDLGLWCSPRPLSTGAPQPAGAPQTHRSEDHDGVPAA